MENMKTSRHIIAYFDIIGYQQMLINHEVDDETFIKAIKAIVDYAHGSAKMDNYGKNIHVYTFSDNIAICISISDKASKAVALRLLTLIACWIQMYSIVTYKIFIRGCIVEGEIYAEHNFLYGQGIVDAYYLESNIAKVPRVIVHENLVEDAIAGIRQLGEKVGGCKADEIIDCDNMFFVLENIRSSKPSRSNNNAVDKSCTWQDFMKSSAIKKDADNLYYVDYLQQLLAWFSVDECTKEMLLDWLDEYAKELIFRMEKFKDDIRSFEKYAKYKWCAEKLKLFLSSIVRWTEFTPAELERIEAFHFFLESWHIDEVWKTLTEK